MSAKGSIRKRRRAQGVQQSPDLPENAFIAQSRAHDPRLRHLAGHGEKLAALEGSELEGLRQPLQDLPVQPRLLAPLDLAHNARRQPCLFGPAAAGSSCDRWQSRSAPGAARQRSCRRSCVPPPPPPCPCSAARYKHRSRRSCPRSAGNAPIPYSTSSICNRRVIFTRLCVNIATTCLQPGRLGARHAPTPLPFPELDTTARSERARMPARRETARRRRLHQETLCQAIYRIRYIECSAIGMPGLDRPPLKARTLYPQKYPLPFAQAPSSKEKKTARYLPFASEDDLPSQTAGVLITNRVRPSQGDMQCGTRIHSE